MSGNSSATGGFLQPLGALPPDDAAFDALLQALVVGITGLPGSLVRPRWQPEPPEQPAQDVDWCGIGEVDSSQIGYPFGQFTSSDTGGSQTQEEWDDVTVLASFYGPNAMGYARMLRAGLFVAQNRETLRSAGLGFTAMDKITRVPEVVNQIWMNRADVTIMFQRDTSRIYNILALLGAAQNIIASTANGTINTSISQGA